MTAVPRVVVLGAGGHARVCLDLLLESEQLEVVGCVGPGEPGRLQRPHLGGDEVLPRLRAQGVEHVFVAIGDNAVRARLTTSARALGFSVLPAISQRATVSPTAVVEAGAAVMAGAVLNAFAWIGEGAIVNTGATVDHDCTIGAYSHLAPGTHLAGDVSVATGAFLGVGTVARPGVRVGDWAITGAGSVLVRDVPEHSTVIGNPARPLRATTSSGSPA